MIYEESDVVIIGGGAAGLSSAVKASEQGISTILIEKEENLGGSTLLAVGSVTAAETLLQKKAGVHDSAEKFFDDLKKAAELLELSNRFMEDEEMFRLYCKEAGKTVDWLLELGIPFHGPVLEPPHTFPRMHNVVPSSLVYINVLRKRAESNGTKILLGVKADELIIKDGKVLGVKGKYLDGNEIEIKSKSVVLATGNYSSNYELKSLSLGEEIAKIEGINPKATGDGILLGIKCGAEIKNMDIMIWCPEIRFIRYEGELLPKFLSKGDLPKFINLMIKILPKSVLTGYIVKLASIHTAPSLKIFEEGAILINKNGNRFVNELSSMKELAVKSSKQPNGEVFILFDEKIAEKFTKWPYYISTFPGIAYAYIQDYERHRKDVFIKVMKLDELSLKGINIENLKKTVEKYNEFVKMGRDPELRKTKLPTTIYVAPYYCLGPLKPYITVTEGGLKINTKCQVVNKHGEIIKGLYAVGDSSAGPIAVTHGIHIGWALTSGRLAAENIMKEEVK
ncbi:MAG: FAD-dependent oxidoreductase [Nitrososphaerota archaeon]